MKIFTIGHSTKPIDEFLDKLVQANVEVVIDVRSRPYSSRFPHFNRNSLNYSLKTVGINYIFKGDSLGGLDENVDFDKAIGAVYELSKTKRLVLLCSEGDFRKCHRYNTLTPIFKGMGATVRHLEWK